MKKISLILVLLLAGCSTNVTQEEVTQSAEPTIAAAVTAEPQETFAATEEIIAEDTECDDKACVALYLNTYEKLPGNYMTKKEARELGWEGGALHLVVEGKCIGGDSFGNYEELLPTENTYYECDIDTLNSTSRGAKRIIYSDDGDIWYTEDHYETFELLYGEGD